ncbi:MAG: hypothetical protein FWE20_11370 [Defluviitaleaceae bacterium]|nr:hypothetical protein [Defluviitaleaceae bacterium]
MARDNVANGINGELRVGDTVVSINNTDYSYLVGTITDIRKYSTPEHGGSNTTDDIHVDFSNEGYSPQRVDEIEKMFTKMHGEFNTIDEIPLDEVIMPPGELINTNIFTALEFEALFESEEAVANLCNEVIAVYCTEKDSIALIDTEAHDTPKREEPTGEYGFHFRPAKHLPDGWGWQEWNDGSGDLVSPEGKSVVSYDLQTKEYKIDGEWNFMGDTKLDREYFERLVRDEYIQIEKPSEKEHDSMSRLAPNRTPAEAALHEPDIHECAETMSLYKKLVSRVNENFADYFDSLWDKSAKEIIGYSSEITIMAQAHYYMTEVHSFRKSELEYILQFTNPLDVVATEFEVRLIEEHSDIMFTIFHEQRALRAGYERVSDDSSVSVPLRDIATNNTPKAYTSVLDHIKRDKEEKSNLHAKSGRADERLLGEDMDNRRNRGDAL